MSTWVELLLDCESREFKRTQEVASTSLNIWSALVGEIESCCRVYNSTHSDFGRGAVAISRTSTGHDFTLEITKSNAPEGKLTLNFPINDGKLAFSRAGTEPAAGAYDISIEPTVPGGTAPVYKFSRERGTTTVRGVVQQLLEPLLFSGDTRNKAFGELQEDGANSRSLVTQPDWFLELLVNLTNGSVSSVELAMTLLVSGFLVSGLMVSGAQYFDGFADEFAAGFPDKEAAADIRRQFSQLGDVYKRDTAIGEAASSSPSAYVHMRDARFFSTAGNPIPGNRGVWWRTRLSEVSGFMVGNLSATK